MVKQDIRSYIPKDKSDVELVNELLKVEYPDYRPILGDLFEWTKDMNWPIAPKISQLLVKSGDDAIPYIKKILDSEDSVWKYCVLKSIVSMMPDGTVSKLRSELEEIVNNPSEDDTLEGVQDLARDLLAKI